MFWCKNRDITINVFHTTEKNKKVPKIIFFIESMNFSVHIIHHLLDHLSAGLDGDVDDLLLKIFTIAENICAIVIYCVG